MPSIHTYIAELTTYLHQNSEDLLRKKKPYTFVFFIHSDIHNGTHS